MRKKNRDMKKTEPKTKSNATKWAILKDAVRAWSNEEEMILSLRYQVDGEDEGWYLVQVPRSKVVASRPVQYLIEPQLLKEIERQIGKDRAYEGLVRVNTSRRERGT